MKSLTLRVTRVRLLSAITSRNNLRPQACLQVRNIATNILHSRVFIDAVRFQEAVPLDSSQPEHFAKLWFSDPARPEFLEGAAGQVAYISHTASQFIPDLKSDFHNSTLTCGWNAVNHPVTHNPVTLP